MPPKKQKQKQRQSQRQVVNINLGKSIGKSKRKNTRRQPGITRVIQQQPIYNFTPQPYQLTPQVFMKPQPIQELEIPTLASQQPKKNTVGEIKMNIPEPVKPKLEQYTEPPLSDYQKPSSKIPENLINIPKRLSGLKEAIESQRQRMEKVKSNPYYENIVNKLPPVKVDKGYDFGKEIERENRERELAMISIPEPFAPKKRGPNKNTMERQQMGTEDINRFF
jgi:hypothetical protein